MKFSTHFSLALLIATTAGTAALAAPPAKKSTAKAAPAKQHSKPAPAASQGSSAAFNNYANQIRGKMANSWTVPSGTNHVTLTIDVAQDGSVNNLTLSSSPKNTEAEQKANDAFNSAQPLQSLPSGVSAATITAVFNSKADQWEHSADISVKIDPKSASTAGGEGEKKEEPQGDKK